jgi:hypothetical protein
MNPLCSKLKDFLIRRPNLAPLLMLGRKVRFVLLTAQSELKLIGFTRLPIKPNTAVTNSMHRVLARESRSVSSAPKEEAGQIVSVETMFPPIMARGFNGAIINCSSSALIVGTEILVPEYYFENRARILCAGGNLITYNDRRGVIDKRRVERINSGIALIGLGSGNWYHWLIEILPMAMLSKALPLAYREYPFLVPECYGKYESFRDSLEIFRAGRKIISLRTRNQYKVDDLIVIDSPVRGPFNMLPGLWPRVTDHEQNELVLKSFRDAILDALSITKSSPSKMLFLARGNSRRFYNQDELSEIAISMGFTVVCPEMLSYREQAELFNSARCIVGPSGAAWTNSLFCQVGTKGLIWTFSQFRESCVYSNLARIAGIDLTFLFHDADSHLTSTGAAYNMGYRIAPDVFRDRLEAIMQMSC